ncbi:hypothetical protein BGZ67_008231 [Mortierella alpina]|nr:hypothetical protein BGZ67_008231 [Mortierella alpina]
MFISKSLIVSALLAAALTVASVSAHRKTPPASVTVTEIPSAPVDVGVIPSSPLDAGVELPVEADTEEEPSSPVDDQEEEDPAPSCDTKKMRSSRKSPNRIGNEKTIAILGKHKFCMFLPPQPGLEVAPTEEDAIAFCKGKGVESPNPMPENFIRSVRYYEAPEKKFVQLTGKFNRDAYELSAADGGGQYDSKNIRGSSCVGYRYFVALVEPDVERFCIRCCANKKDCPTHKSHLGCGAVVPDLA